MAAIELTLSPIPISYPSKGEWLPGKKSNTSKPRIDKKQNSQEILKRNLHSAICPNQGESPHSRIQIKSLI
jgi:hypothetical protein